MTSPSSPATYKEGDDFATSQLHNPWDFNERRDIGWEENFSGPSVGVSGGVWSGTNASSGGYVFPLFPGFKGALQADPAPGDRTLPKLGINHKIDASKYTRLCYKARNSDRGTFAVYWSNDESKPQYWPDGSNKGASYDGYYPYPWNLGILNSGWQIYCFDMTSLSSSFESVAGSWTGNIFALRLDPSTGAGQGATTDIDWVRVVDPASSPTINVTWSTSGISNQLFRTLYVDTASSGHTGVPIARFINGTDPGSYSLKTAGLPPGRYYFYVTAQATSPGALSGSPIYSNYSSPITINATPQAEVTAPSFTSGAEFSGSELGNAWDMDSATDVENLNRASYPDVLRQFSSESFVTSSDAVDGKIFQASANPPLPGANESDDQVHMNVPANHPIDAGKYRYLSYRIAADETNFPTISDKVANGWVTRPVWWNNDVLADGGDPGAHVLYEGWHTYAYDLWTLPIERGIPWSSNSHLKNLRIDPLETHIPTWFFLDFVKLYAENRTSSNQYTVSWKISDEDSTSFTVSLYYDTDNSGFNGTPITTLNNVTAGANSYVWNTSGLTNGTKYWVYMVVSDGTNTSRAYSPVHVVQGDYVPTPVPRAGIAEFDYDGDARSDLALYRPGGVQGKKKKPKVDTTTYSEILVSSTNSLAQNVHADRNARLLGLDLNGDHMTDLLTVGTRNGLLEWSGILSRSAAPYYRIFGVAGDVPLKGDFNGNGSDEIGVFRGGLWYFMNELNQVILQPWGVPGDIAVPADYDGDGATDIAIFRPATGEWWIINSGFGGGFAPAWYSVFQFGLPGDVPMQADYDGDGRADCAVFRPSEGLWYVRYSHDGSTHVTSWGHGVFGDIPFHGLDVNGDGKADYVVFRPSVATWFINYGNGQTLARPFGLPTDQVPSNH